MKEEEELRGGRAANREGRLGGAEREEEELMRGLRKS